MWWSHLGSRARGLLCAAAFAMLAGCPAEESGELHPNEWPEDRPYHDAKKIPCPSNLPEMRIGMIAQGLEGRARGELIDAEAIPVVPNYNDWVVEFRDPDGEVIDGLELVRVQPFMPAHNHDAFHDVIVNSMAEPGRYEAKEINIWMEGPWEVRFFLELPDGSEETVIFDVCREQVREDAGAD